MTAVMHIFLGTVVVACLLSEFGIANVEEPIERQLGNAAATGNISLARQLLATYPTIGINWVDNQVYNECEWTVSNSTALLRAAKCNQSAEMIRLLVFAGANISLKDSLQCTPLLWTAWNGNSDLFYYLAFLKRDSANDGIKGYKETVLLTAVLARRVNVLRELFYRDYTPVNSADKDGTTALMYAAMNGYLDVVNFLLEKGANCSVKNNNGKTALMFADKQIFPEVVLAIENCTKWEVINKLGLELGNAASANDIAKVKNILADNGTRLDIINWHDLGIKTESGRIYTADLIRPTALIRAILKHGNLNMIALLIDAGANVNEQTQRWDNSPLMVATLAGAVRVVKYLINRGANVNWRGSDSGSLSSPVKAAIFLRRADILQLLIDNGANVSDPNNLVIAVDVRGFEDIVPILLASGANRSLCQHSLCRVTTTTPTTTTVSLSVSGGGTTRNFTSPFTLIHRQFHQAVVKGNLTIIKEMLSVNYTSNTSIEVDVNWVDVQVFNVCGNATLLESTALLKAVKCRQSSQVILALIQAGANVNYSPYGYPGMTPLMMAVTMNDIDMVRLLLNRKTSTFGYDSNGASVLMLAAKSGSAELVSLLLNVTTNHGLIWGKGQLNGTIALHIAAMNGNTAAVRALLDRFPDDVGIKQLYTGETAFSIAASRGYNDIVKVLTTMYGVTLSKPTVVLTTLRPNFTNFATTTRRAQTRKEIVHRQFSDAVVYGNLSLINEMLSYNGSSQAVAIDVNWVDAQMFTECGNLTFYESTVLLKAVKCRRSSSIISALIEAGANINYSPYEYPGMTPLMVAASNNDIAMISFLLYKNASSNVYNSNRELVFTQAARQGNTGIMSLLMNRTILKRSTRPEALHAAAMNGRTEAVRLILDRFPDTLNMKDRTSGATALILAARKGYNETMKLLLDYGADVNATDLNGTKAVEAALAFGVSAVLKTLIAKSGFLNTTRLMTSAIQNGSFGTVKTLLESGVSSNLTDGYGDSILLKACSLGKLEIARLLIDNGADENARARNGTTILMRTVQIAENRTDILRLLLDNGAKVNDKAEGVNSGWTAFTYASKIVGNEETLQLLVDRGANINQEALFTAIKDGDKKMVRFLLDNGANVNAEDVTNNGWTALMYQVRMYSSETSVMQLLLDRGANINQKDDYGETALFKVVDYYYSAEKTAIFLLDHGADANDKQNFGITPLSVAVARDHINMVRVLLQMGAWTNVTDGMTDMPLVRAMGLSSLEIFNLLLDYGVDVNATYFGYLKITALMYAALQGKTGALSILLDRGADINALNYKNQTALMMAAEFDRYIAVRLLLKRGADRSTCIDMLCL